MLYSQCSNSDHGMGIGRLGCSVTRMVSQRCICGEVEGIEYIRHTWTCSTGTPELLRVTYRTIGIAHIEADWGLKDLWPSDNEGEGDMCVWRLPRGAGLP
jgi:hypothetical protein